MSIKLTSNAKINIGLKIHHKRDDKYHDISTLLQEIDLCDDIKLSKNNSSKIENEGSDRDSSDNPVITKRSTISVTVTI